MANDNSKKPKKASNGPVAQFYLFLYNALQTVGWSYLLFQTVQYLWLGPKSKNTSLYDEVSLTVIIFQNLAVLEVIHAAIGLVPSSVQITLQQIASRVIVVCGALMISTNSRATIGFPMLLFAWSITEIIRYSNYALNIANMVPYFLVYLRYTTFYALYPIGVTGELLCLYATYSQSRQDGFQLPVFPDLTLYYSYALLFIMFLYIPLFPQMYLHMIKQRKKVLQRPCPDKTK